MRTNGMLIAIDGTAGTGENCSGGLSGFRPLFAFGFARQRVLDQPRHIGPAHAGLTLAQTQDLPLSFHHRQPGRQTAAGTGRDQIVRYRLLARRTRRYRNDDGQCYDDED